MIFVELLVFIVECDGYVVKEVLIKEFVIYGNGEKYVVLMDFGYKKLIL